MTECVIVDNQVETCDPPRAFMESVSARPLTLAVGVATTGRRDILSAVLPLLTEQSRLPDRLVVSIADPSDVDRSVVTALPFPTEILSGPKGLCAQRNRILEQVADADLLVFLDDDYLLDPTYLAEAEKLFSSQVDVVVATGCVLADGIHGRGMEVSEGRRRLLEGAQPKTDNLADIYGAYGCNMLVRLAPVRENAITFDEALPLYGWLEDIDFSRRVAPFGRVVRCSRLQGVHLGTKRGRAAGLKLGYAQVANPVYLARKGSVSLRFSGRLVVRNICANFIHCLTPEPWIDRRGRLAGNFTALLDHIRGRLSPGRITCLD